MRDFFWREKEKKFMVKKRQEREEEREMICKQNVIIFKRQNSRNEMF